MKNILIICLLLQSISIQINGQNPPEVIPNTPSATNFLRYGEIPVSYSTGTPNIEIPLYTIEEGSLEIPITLSYHAGGIKVSDISSEVGLGWVLNTGGCLVKTHYGAEDCKDYADPSLDYLIHGEEMYNDIESIENENDEIIMADILKDINYYKTKDTKADRYFYQIPGHQGIIRRDLESQGQPYCPIPYSPIRFDVDNGTIITEDGAKYTFDDYLCDDPDLDYFPLEKIESSTGNDVINFFYNNDLDDYYSYMYINYMVEGDQLQETPIYRSYELGTCLDWYTDPYIVNDNLQQKKNYDIKMLNYISTDQVKVEFIYDLTTGIQQKRRLDKIIISNIQTDETIKIYKLIQSHFSDSENSNFRLRLDKVEYYGNSLNNTPQVYSMSYNDEYTENALVPWALGISPITTEFADDFWGYYNSEGDQSGNIHSSFLDITMSNSFGRNRFPNSTYTQNYILTKIEYPTGGYTEFFYEPNEVGSTVYEDFTDAGNRTTVGGLRIQSIQSINPNGSSFLKSYVYEDPIFRKIRSDYFTKKDITKRCKAYQHTNCNIYPEYYIWDGELNKTFIIDQYFGNPIFDINITPNNPVIYKTVYEYIGTPENNSGRTKYTYKEPHFSSLEFSDEIDVYGSANFNQERYKPPYYEDYGLYVPKIKSKEEQYFDENSLEWITIKKTTNNYSKYTQNIINTGFWIFEKEVYKFFDEYGEFFEENYTLYDEYFENLVIVNTRAFQEREEINEVIIEENGVETHTYFEYDNEDHMFPTKIKTTGSNVLDKIEWLHYPLDYTIDDDGYMEAQEISNMIARNVINIPIEKVTLYGDKVTEGTLNMYKEENNLIVPDYTLVLETDTPVELDDINDRENFDKFNFSHAYLDYNDLLVKIRKDNLYPESSNPNYKYHSDEFGNIIQVDKLNDISTSYFYGYKKSYPVIEAINVSYEEIGFTDFSYTADKSDDGNWNLNNNGFEYYEVFGTVNYENRDCFRLLNWTNDKVSISKSLDVSKKYKISFWAKAIHPITFCDITIPEDTEWEFYSYEISNCATININAAIGYDAYIDDVMIYPTSENINTYTYEPLKGMISKTDPNGITTYYEYDDFGRLKCIKDNSKDIIQEYEYNYADQ